MLIRRASEEKLKLTNDIMETIDSGKITILTALDMSAAFDILDHFFTDFSILLVHPVVWSLGFVHITFHHHTNRRASGLCSRSSSLIFVLFISPIANVINSDKSNQNNIVSFHQYADDTQLYIVTNSSTLTLRLLQLNPAPRESMTGF